MQVHLLLIAIVVGYLVGSISFARIVTGWLDPGADVTRMRIQLEGFDNSFAVHSIGANTVSGRYGAKAGMLIAVLDMLKALIVTLTFKLLLPEQPYYLVASLAVMIGHIYPVYHKFLGGSGWTPALGSLLVIDPLAVIVCPLLAGLIGLLVLRNFIFAMIGWLWLLVPWLWLHTHDLTFVWYALGLNLVFILAMLPVVRNALKLGSLKEMIAYGRGILAQNPMGRGYVKMAQRLKIKVG